MEENLTTDAVTESTENDTPPESSPETNETEATQSDGGEDTRTETERKPFHEDPKIRDFVERQAEKKAEQKMAQLREEYQRELAKMREELSPKQKEAKESVEVPHWFGGDEAAWSDFQAYLGSLKKEARAEAIAELKESAANEKRLMQEATDYMNAEIAAIETDTELNPDRVQFDKNRLAKIVEEFNLQDPKTGLWNWRGAAKFYLMQEKAARLSQPKQDLSEKRRIAAATVSGSRTVQQPAEYKTPEDFVNNEPW